MLNPLLELTLGSCGSRTLILFIDDFSSLVLVRNSQGPIIWSGQLWAGVVCFSILLRMPLLAMALRSCHPTHVFPHCLHRSILSLWPPTHISLCSIHPQALDQCRPSACPQLSDIAVRSGRFHSSPVTSLGSQVTWGGKEMLFVPPCPYCSQLLMSGWNNKARRVVCSSSQLLDPLDSKSCSTICSI